MNFTVRVWRQRSPSSPGGFVMYPVSGVTPDMSFLEVLDMVNEGLLLSGQEPIAFDSDCREGICGTCSLVINGRPHGGQPGTTTCQLYMRHFQDGEVITVEPWRVKPFPLIKDLVVDRSALDAIIQAGGFISVGTGGAPDANAIPISKDTAHRAMDAAACIGCGACVAVCQNASAMLFVGAKVTHLGLLPQGQLERDRRAMNLVQAMEEAGFGNCTATGACATVCPKEIKLEVIARLNRDFGLAILNGSP